MGLLEHGLLSDQARIVIAGSEAARGDVPMMNPVDLPDFAAKYYEGDLASAAESLIRSEGPLKYKPMTAYTNAKLFVAYWSAALARKLPAGMTVNAVSPGSAPSTNADRNANFLMRFIMIPIIRLVPGMSAPVSAAASRYIEAAEYSEQVNGEFFASAPKKMIGQLHRCSFPTSSIGTARRPPGPPSSESPVEWSTQSPASEGRWIQDRNSKNFKNQAEVGMSTVTEEVSQATKVSIVRKNWVLFVVSLTTFMVFVDATVVNTALPSIARDFAATNSHFNGW